MALHITYRPKELGEVVGQDAVVRSLQKAIDDGGSHAYLFTGPSGVGKTTLARIVASKLGCLPQDLTEVDAATFTGIDDMRAVAGNTRYRPLGAGAVKCVIVDECQALSKAAWQSLLKSLEEPPDWVYWFLCTTEPTRVLPTIRTRCMGYDLKPVAMPGLIELIERVARDAEIDLGEHGPQVISACAREARGSPRQALVNLAMCAGVGSAEEAREILRSADQLPEAVELARLLVKGASWSEVQALLKDLKDTNPESIRHVVRGYVSKVVLGAKSEDNAGWGLEILDAFSEPYVQGDGAAPLILSCGRLVLGE